MQTRNEADSTTNSTKRSSPSDENLARAIPERLSLDGLEERWIAKWEEEGIFHFDRAKSRSEVFSIDTPPPTVSGSLHVGHVFSYTQTDIIARFQRMLGKEVFYPIGWDDNGLPTERRVQNYFGVRCDPTVAYDASFVPPAKPFDPPLAISRPNFVELCHLLTIEDERAFEALFRRLGLSVDWNLTYTTISTTSQRASQRDFLDLVARGEVYRQEAPTLWDIDFASAIAQAELEDREIAGAYHRLRFEKKSAPADIEIETTRPELLTSCVALVAHPDDARYDSAFGKTVRTPLFRVEVPVLAHPLADPEKGSGIAMVCTFGDLTDVTWWRELKLPTRTVIGRDGRFEADHFGEEGWPSDDFAAAHRNYAELVGKTVRQAQRRIVELLKEDGSLIAEPKPITHAVKFYERGERPLEIVSSRQWYVRTMAMRDELLRAGQALIWHPEFMQGRYESWVEGLTGDWNISRQRFFGVPFPIWYQIDDSGSIDDAQPILAIDAQLPVDPSVDVPPGYAPEQRGVPGGFAGDPDVMDTWATSSLSPQIAGCWREDPDLFARVFPMDVRPQAHEIIRTWLFSTVVRSLLSHHSLPFAHAAISGWILDPDRKKMAKSRGNVVVPTELLEKHGTDAVRYWAASARLGTDTVFDETQMKIGRRLAIKILNASKFVLSIAAGKEGEAPVLWPLDEVMFARLTELVTAATADLERYDHARALERTEQFFWTYCDDYVELVKVRAYGEDAGAASARAALVTSLEILLGLFAPVLPFATEEAWSWSHDDSIHRSSWPTLDNLRTVSSDGLSPSNEQDLLGVVGTVLREVRRAKTEAKFSLAVPVARVEVRAPAPVLDLLARARQDLVDAGRITTLELIETTSALEVTVVLGEPSNLETKKT